MKIQNLLFVTGMAFHSFLHAQDKIDVMATEPDARPKAAIPAVAAPGARSADAPAANPPGRWAV